MKEINFIALDFETATSKHTSICEVGICIVKNGKIAEKKSWLVRPENNYYHYRNIMIHGISPKETENAPEFPEIWSKICQHLYECPILVAHNASFDISCLRQSLSLYGIDKPDIPYYCSLRAARHLYDFGSNSLDNLCNIFDIQCGTHHRAENDAEMCARLFLQEIKDSKCNNLSEMNFCCGKL